VTDCARFAASLNCGGFIFGGSLDEDNCDGTDDEIDDGGDVVDDERLAGTIGNF
jgi:hypothetical protein